MGTITKPAVPAWARREDEPWERTPIWDAEFAERWEALHRELVDEPEPAPARKPRQPRKPRQAATRR